MIFAAAQGNIDQSTIYDIIFYLHILAAIVGYGTVFLNGIYGQQATTRPATEGAAIASANLSVGNVAEWFIYANAGFGIIMAIMAEGDVVAFDQAWLSISMLLWIAALGISHGVMRPSAKKLTADLEREAEGAEPGSTGIDRDALEKRMGAAGAALNLAVVVILYLMVFKPGV